MSWRPFVQHLLSPLPTLLLGVVAGVGVTFVALGWLTRWHAAQMPEPVPVPPEAWLQLGAFLAQAGLTFLLPLLVIGVIWLVRAVALLRCPAVMPGGDA